MRILTSVFLLAGFSLAFPSSVSAERPLPPGKPAGVRQAGVTSERREMYVFAGVAIVSAGLAVVLIGDKDDVVTTSTAP
jgi:hypothetical protein